MQNKFKRLAIISDCIHMFNQQGVAVTEVHIFCRQMQALASWFETTVICCPFVPYSSHKITTHYTNKSITFIPLKNVGGNTLKSKLGIITNIPAWIKSFNKAGQEADIVYLRFPNNLNIISFFYFYFKGAKTFASYTGTWANYKNEPPTYRFQKWILRNMFKGPAWLYITDEQAGKNLFKGISPSYTLSEWEEETEQVKNRIEKIKNFGIPKPVFITVGALNANKNQQYILDAFKILNEEGFAFHLNIVGDGELRASYENFVACNNLGATVTVCGAKNYSQLRQLYRQSDFLIQAALVEGFGKVPIEGFFHGVVPLLNKVALAEEMAGNGKRGFVFLAEGTTTLITLIKQVCENSKQLVQMVENGRTYAKVQTLEIWAQTYIKKINEYFG